MTLVTSERRGASALLTYANPPFGTMTAAGSNEMLAAVRAAVADAGVRAIVITGAGRAFSSGADLKDSETLRPDGTVDVLTPLRESYNPLIMRVRTIDKPVIAAVNGPAAGIGCSLALCCGTRRSSSSMTLFASARSTSARSSASEANGPSRKPRPGVTALPSMISSCASGPSTVVSSASGPAKRSATRTECWRPMVRGITPMKM